MSSQQTDELCRTLARLQLVEKTPLEECLRQLPPGAEISDLLRQLENKHLLTSFQVMRLQKGDIDGLVLGRYKLMYRNASGSFARVYRAGSLDDGRMLGLKVLRQRWAEDPRTVASFHREAELGKKLKHKNIVPIYEVGSQGDYHYFTMDFIVGGNLRDFINIRKTLSPVEATQAYADRISLVHLHDEKDGEGTDIGEGPMCDFSAFLTAITETGYDDWVVVCPGGQKPATESILSNRTFLKSLGY